MTHIGKEAFIIALNDSGLQLEVMKREPQTIDAALSHAIKLEAYELSLSFLTSSELNSGPFWGHCPERKEDRCFAL